MKANGSTRRRATRATAALAVAVRLGVRRALGLPLTRRCMQCWQTKPLAVFGGARGGLISRCSACQARYGGWDRMTPAERMTLRRPVRRTGDGFTARLTVRSMNRKTGPIPVSSTDMASCPPSCPHLDRGCYAGYGKAGSHWKNVAARGVPWAAFCAQVKALPAGVLWRHNEAGDLPGHGAELDVGALAALVRANRGKHGFTFTHKPLTRAVERRAVAAANAAGFRINLSADSLEAADRLAALGIAPVAVVVPAGTKGPLRTPGGRQVVVCPATTHDLTCERCGLCAKARVAIVAFPAHGQGASFVELRLRAKEKPC